MIFKLRMVMRVDALVDVARAAIGVLAACALTAQAQGPVQTQEQTLANGLRVIVKEDHRAPTVASMVWYKAGSMDEFNGTTGVAHVLEHMMFKGTREVPGGEFSRLVAAAGGRENAFTSRDYTAYFQQVHKSQLALAFRLEADRMANLVISKEEFDKEIRVVMEERRLRTEDQPRALVHEQLMATAFTAHPYRWPVVGWMSDLEAHDLHRRATIGTTRWYAPNNAIVVVVGDVVAKDVFALAEKYFGPVKAKPLPERKPQDEPPQRGIRRVDGQGAGRTALLDDGLARAGAARRRQGMGALRARNARRRARRQRSGAPEQHAGTRRENRQRHQRRLRQHAARARLCLQSAASRPPAARWRNSSRRCGASWRKSSPTASAKTSSSGSRRS